MRQHATPVLVDREGNAVPLTSAFPAQGGHGFSEADIQQLIHQHPSCLPIAEIDPLFRDPVPICTELATPAGSIDNLMITADGLPVLVECKLWKNPESRREVVGQILDYAKELTQWSSSDLQREVSRRLKRPGNVMLDLLRDRGHEINEIEFNDAVSLNLRRGRILLIIVGDGIRQGVEAIAQYLQVHAGLQFTLGLVELPVFAMPDGRKLVVPRILAKTENIVRTVIEVPNGMNVLDVVTDDDDEDGHAQTPEQRAKRQESKQRRREERLEFWTAFLDGLQLDDPDQPLPGPSRSGNVSFMLPAPGGSSWLTVYRSKSNGTVGVFLSRTRNSPGDSAARSLAADRDALREELGPGATLHFDENSTEISDRRSLANFGPSAEREEAFRWLRRRTNDFINALRPRIRAAIAEMED